MVAVNKVNSNVVGFSYVEEATIGVLPASPIFIGLEPNTFADFGPQVTTTARNFINSSRQRSKGVITDLDATGGFQSDMTQENMQLLLQGFVQADLRRKGEAKNAPGITTLTISVTSATDTYTRVGGSLDLTTQFSVGSLVFMAGFANSDNNGLFVATAVTATTVVVAEADGVQTAAVTVDEGATSSGSIVQVGVETDDSDLDIAVTGSVASITSTALDFTTLGLIPGETLYIGGDAAGTFFATNPVNRTLVFILTISANEIVFWKTDGTMIAESAGASDQIHIYFGRVLKNEAAALIKRRSYQFERTLDFNDDASPANLQAEYLLGAVSNQFTWNLNQADKITTDLTFVANDGDTLDENALPTFFKGTAIVADAIKSQSANLGASLVSLASGAAFNTSSDFSRIKLAGVDLSDNNPVSSFAFATEITINVNNNVSSDKAVGTLGGFDVTSGTFEVGGSLTAYFSTVAAIQSVRNNDNITLDMFVVANNAGYTLEIPLLALGDGRLNIELNQPITLPLTLEGARGRDIDAGLDYSLMMSFFDFLPTAAQS